MSSAAETSLSSLLFAFGELALARHNPNKFGPALAYPQLSSLLFALCSILRFLDYARYDSDKDGYGVNDAPSVRTPKKNPPLPAGVNLSKGGNALIIPTLQFQGQETLESPHRPYVHRA